MKRKLWLGPAIDAGSLPFFTRLVHHLLVMFAVSAVSLVLLKLFCEFHPLDVTIAKRVPTPKWLANACGNSVPSMMTQFEPYDPDRDTSVSPRDIREIRQLLAWHWLIPYNAQELQIENAKTVVAITPRHLEWITFCKTGDGWKFDHKTRPVGCKVKPTLMDRIALLCEKLFHLGEK